MKLIKNLIKMVEIDKENIKMNKFDEVYKKIIAECKVVVEDDNSYEYVRTYDNYDEERRNNIIDLINNVVLNTYTGKYIKYREAEPWDDIRWCADELYDKNFTEKFLNARVPTDLIPKDKLNDPAFQELLKLVEKSIDEWEVKPGKKSLKPLLFKFDRDKLNKLALSLNESIKDETYRKQLADAAEEMGLLRVKNIFK